MTAARRRREAALAGLTGDTGRAGVLVDDPDPAVRAAALGALARLGSLDDGRLACALADHHPTVRRRAALLAAARPQVSLAVVLGDDDPLVVDAAAWSCGERATVDDATFAALSEVAGCHADPRCRESAVAALGALGDPRAVSLIIAALADRPAVRRRAVLALAPFDGPEVDAALERARNDRDWQVRQAAEDLT